MRTKKIVITGSPGTGKTSIINSLKRKKYYCFDEIIRTLTLEAKKEREASALFSNPIAFVKDPMAFNVNVLEARISQFKHAERLKNDITFFDRGIPDVLAYMSFFKQQGDDFFTEACKSNAYDTVFMLPPWKAIYKKDNERFETFEESREIHVHLKATYQSFGYHIIEVPFDTIENRTQFILNQLKPQ